MALAVVRVSSGYFAVLECISYSTQEATSCFSLGLGLHSQNFQFWIVYHNSCARKRSWLSQWLGLAVYILQCWHVYPTVRKKDIRVSR